MKLPTAAEMADLDRRAIQELKIPALVLMENAGLGVVQALFSNFPGLARMRVGLLAGRGNNGGDALVGARHLRQKGIDCQVFLLCPPSDLRGEAKANLEAYQGTRGKLKVVDSEAAWAQCRSELAHCQLLVDGILGTGLKSEVTGFYSRVIQEVNQLKRPLLAIDVPSGLDATTGKVLGVAIEAKITVTFGLPKMGLILHPGASYAGKVIVHDIGIPAFLVAEANIKTNLIDRNYIRSLFTPRKEDTHKGDYGRLLMVAGSPGMTGAASLASLGALRSGPGLITLAIPRSLNPIMETKVTEVMTLPLEETREGSFAASALKKLEEIWGRMNALVIGPGILPHPDTLELLAGIIEKCPCPLVVDAGGLDAIAAGPEVLKRSRSHVIITPHPGEMARIIKSSTEEVQGDRLGTARRVAAQQNAIVVLKGSRTVVACPSGEAYINPTGNPGMASGGMGDVLTGMVGGFLAQGLSPEGAAVAAVYLHGLAGDRAADKKGQLSLAASDLLEELPLILKEMEQELIPPDDGDAP